MSPPPPNESLSRITATRRQRPWDPWNSSATGHQRAETQAGTGWRQSRSRKLNSQFRVGDGSGGERLSDTWGAGAMDSSGTGKKSVMEMLARPGLMRKRQTLQAEDKHRMMDGKSCPTAGEAVMEQRRLQDEEKEKEKAAEARDSARKLFAGVTVYVNGSTFPLVSDHRLKQLITENGGNVSLHLGRRKVTHVIVGRLDGFGGGLAAGKLEREMRRVGGCGVKFVGVEWVLQSLREGKRLPEARFSHLKVAAKAQNSVYGLYSKQDTLSEPAPSVPPSGQSSHYD